MNKPNNGNEFDENFNGSVGGIAASIDDTITGHLLQKMGILKTFTISKLISSEDLSKLQEDVAKKSTNDKEYQKNMKDSFEKMSINNCKKEHIPGAIYNKQKNKTVSTNNAKLGNDLPPVTNERIDRLNEFSTFLADQIMKEKISKKEASFVIISIIKILGLDSRSIDEGNGDGPEEEEND